MANITAIFPLKTSNTAVAATFDHKLTIPCEMAKVTVKHSIPKKR